MTETGILKEECSDEMWLVKNESNIDFKMTTGQKNHNQSYPLLISPIRVNRLRTCHWYSKGDTNAGSDTLVHRLLS